MKAIPLSVDLWIHYLNHVKTVLTEPEEIRAVYERALGQCGREWKSDKIWDNYVKWEQVGQKCRNIIQISIIFSFFRRTDLT